jgi:hypothetical protein
MSAFSETRSGGAPLSVGGVWLALLRAPAQHLLWRWNWKAALLSACTRGSLFFVATLKAGFDAAVSALLIEAAFYATVAGFYGALLEAFRKAQPVWAATLTMMALLPLLNHTLEFTLHALSGTQRLGVAVTVSALFSLGSACFNLFAMRRGVLIVGAERQSLLADLRRLPGVVCEFLACAPLALWRAWLK